jgi:dienelactone hydrolase
MLASRGYAAFNLAYFAEPGLPRGLVNIPLEYFEHAIRWTRAQPWLHDGFLAAWGPSRGGELALLLGATFPDINAVSAWVPSGVMFWPIGLAEQGDTRPPASWTWHGKPLPYLQENNGSVEALPPQQPGQPTAYTPIYLRHLRDERAVERATIPVENIRGPILLVSGTDDQMWPSSVLADIAMRRLQSNGFKFPFQHLKYQGAGHSFCCPTDRERRTTSVSRPKALAALYTSKGERRGPTPRLVPMRGIRCCNSWRPAPGNTDKRHPA